MVDAIDATGPTRVTLHHPVCHGQAQSRPWHAHGPRICRPADASISVPIGGWGGGHSAPKSVAGSLGRQDGFAIGGRLRHCLGDPPRSTGRRVMRHSRNARSSAHGLMFWLIATLGLLLAANLAGAASLDEIKKRGYLVAATEDDYPPFEFVKDGQPQGLDHALIDVLKKSAPF